MSDATILNKIKSLPPEKRREVMDFVDFLLQRSEPVYGAEPFYGMWEDLEVELGEDDVAEVRREMWSGFPRGDLP